VPPAPENRPDVPDTATRAAYRAHKADEHNGRYRPGCITCANYAAALTREDGTP